jgi:uncharacterized protein with PIN domain
MVESPFFIVHPPVKASREVIDLDSEEDKPPDLSICARCRRPLWKKSHGMIMAWVEYLILD